MTRKGPVSFHDQPPSSEASNRYKKAIEDAKKGVSNKEVGIPNAQRFSDEGDSWKSSPSQTADQFLRPETKQQLKALAEANAEASQRIDEVVEEEERSTDSVVEEEESESPEDKMRKAIEGRIDKLDIGQYIMSGVATQLVPVIPEKLEVVYRTITDAEEVYVDKILSLEKEITSRQFIRRSNEYALATHIHSVNGNKWPSHLNSLTGEVDLDVMEVRLGHIRKLSSPIFNLLTDNLNWFLQRVHKELTFEVLGNG